MSAETIEFTSRLIERSWPTSACPSPWWRRRRPCHHALRNRAGHWRQGQPDRQPGQDLARALSLVSIRVVETIPGKNLMGLELPNPRRQMVKLSEILGSQTYHASHSVVTMALGKDIAGNPVVADLAKMPHLLVAGTTGSGKSVGINAMILSLLYKADASHASDPDRSEDARNERLRRHSAPAGAGGHGHAPGRQRAELVRGRNGKALPPDEQDGRAQPGRLQHQDPRRHQARGTHPQSVLADARPARAAGAAAHHRGGHRRAGRPDDGGGQEDRRADRAPGAEGARRRHPPDPGHPAPQRGRDHRPDQGQHPDPHRLSGFVQDRLAHHSRPDGRGNPAGPGRHALHAAGHRPAGARARRLCQRR